MTTFVDPRPKRQRTRRGSTLVEFTLLGIPAIFLFTSVMTCSVDMWQFFTLSYAVNQTARYAALHGASCASPNSCQVLRSDIATYFQGQAMALDPASTTMKLDDGSGVITCNPVTSCPSASSVFPSSGHNAPNGANSVTVSATYTLTNPIFMFWPGSSTNSVVSSRFVVGATSTQQILF